MILGDYHFSTSSHDFEFYWVQHGFLVRHLHGQGWASLVVNVDYFPTHERQIVDVGPSLTGEIIVPFTRHTQNLPSNVLPSTSFYSGLLNNQRTVIAIPSILELSVPTLRRESVSSEQRFQQTLAQVQSVRQYCPNILLILQELSVHVKEDWLKQLAPYCDWILLYGEDKTVYPYAHEWSCDNKGLGEMVVTLHLLHTLRDTPIQTFIKFGGRYALQPSFSLDNITYPLPSFSGIYTGTLYGFLVYTVMYVLPKDYWPSFRKMLESIYIDRHTSIEKRYTAWLSTLPAFAHIRSFHIEGLCIGTGETLHL